MQTYAYTRYDARLALHCGRTARKHTDDDTPMPSGLYHMLAAASVIFTDELDRLN